MNRTIVVLIDNNEDTVAPRKPIGLTAPVIKTLTGNKILKTLESAGIAKADAPCLRHRQ